MRRKDEKVLMKALKGDREGRRPTGRPRGRWLDALGGESKNTLKFRNWRRLAAEDRDVWTRRIEETKRPKLGYSAME
jgi:hypothetical protein